VVVKNQTRVLHLWAPVVVYMAAIFYVSSLQQPAIPAGGDKPWHTIAYFGLAIVVVRAIAGGLPRRIRGRPAGLAMTIAVTYAVTDEIHQMFVPGRSAEVADLIADAIGVCGGTVACWAWGVIRHNAHVTSHTSQNDRS
jgi:VanZ family protein